MAKMCNSKLFLVGFVILFSKVGILIIINQRVHLVVLADRRVSVCSLMLCYSFVQLSFFYFQVVLSCVEDSPAARAGIHEGDELIEINGI